MTINNLIDAIKQCQKNKGWTDTEFTKRLGYRDRSSWNYIKSGRCPPTLKFFRGVIREFPELKPLVDRWIYGAMPQGVFERSQDGHRTVFRKIVDKCYSIILKPFR